MEKHKSLPTQAEPHRKLAFEVTAMVHGEQQATKAKMMSELLFDTDMHKLDTLSIFEAFKGDDVVCRLKQDEFVGNMICDVAARSGVTASKTAARKLVASGGLYLNYRRVLDPQYVLKEGDMLNCMSLIRSGKTKYKILRIE